MFKSNKRILLYLFQIGILVPTAQISKLISTSHYTNSKYSAFLYPELNIKEKYINLNENDEEIIKDYMSSKSNQDIFDALRKEGENDDEVCKFIRDDFVDEFISYKNEKHLDLSSKIPFSLFETHNFLIEHPPTLIEYAAFFGSVQIFKSLLMHHCPYTQMIWLYAVHSNNIEIIHLLENENVEVEYVDVFCEAIKCHHNAIANYIRTNHLQTIFDEQEKRISDEAISSFNYEFISTNINQISKNFTQFCKYDYYHVVKCILASDSFIDINKYDEVEDMTPLNYAIENNDSQLVKIILNHPDIDVNRLAKPLNDDKTIISPLFMAITKNNSEIVQMLIAKSDCDVNLYSDVTFEDEIYLYDESAFRVNDAEPNGVAHLTPLCAAIERNNSKIVNLLLQQSEINVNLEAYFNNCMKLNPLNLAYQVKNLEIFELLVDLKETDVNHPLYSFKIFEGSGGGCFIKRSSLLFNIIKNKDVQFLSILLKNPKLAFDETQNFFSYQDEGVNVPIITIETILMAAVDSPELLELVLKQPKINVNMLSSVDHIRYDVPYTILVDRIYHSEESLNRVFVDYEVKEIMSRLKQTLLHYATENNMINIVKDLLKHDDLVIHEKRVQGQIVNGKYQEKEETALEIAQSKGFTEIVELLQ